MFTKYKKKRETRGSVRSTLVKVLTEAIGRKRKRTLASNCTVFLWGGVRKSKE